MFDNIGTSIVQAIGFFGVFGFFIYQLLSDKNITDKTKLNVQQPKVLKNTSKKSNFNFFKKKPKQEKIELPKKKGWFK